MKKLVIIDGNGILYRAYHAMPPLTDPNGILVNAVYGFFSMLLSILAEQKPDFLAVCFDRSKPTIRQSLYVGYHAHRPKMEDDMIAQIERIDHALHKMGVQIFSVDGYEADDVIGTIATIVQEKKVIALHGKIETVIVTGDRDLLQLVDKQTKVLMPVTGLSKTQLFDEAKVEEKYGVRPDQFIDYKALIGDPSDGYPGVSGIGPKTAAQLLKTYTTFENLYQHLGDVTQKQAKQLATDAEQAALAKKLATIVRDVPFSFALSSCQCDKFNIQGLEEAFRSLGFKTLTKRMLQLFPPKPEKEQLELLSN